MEYENHPAVGALLTGIEYSNDKPSGGRYEEPRPMGPDVDVQPGDGASVRHGDIATRGTGTDHRGGAHS
jgi:hypothetical protein